MSPSLAERDLACVWHPCTQMKDHESIPLVETVRGEGPWLYDTQGRRYLDAVSSWWVNLFGHAQPDIARAREVLGWEPKVDLDAGLERTLAYFRSRLGA